MAQNPPEDNRAEKSHEKAQQPKAPGSVTGPRKGPVSMGTQDWHDRSPESSLAAKVDAICAGLSPDERKLLEERLGVQEVELAAALPREHLLAWAKASEDEIRAGRELDAVIRSGEDQERAEARWYDALERVKVTYDRIGSSSDLDAAKQLAKLVEPKSPREQPPAALGRALLQIRMVVWRNLVREYRPEICASTPDRQWRVSEALRAAENRYTEARRGADLADRTEAHATVLHLRALMVEVDFLVSVNTEVRAFRAAVRAYPSNETRSLFAALFESEEVERDWTAATKEFPELDNARALREHCQSIREWRRWRS